MGRATRSTTSGAKALRGTREGSKPQGQAPSKMAKPVAKVNNNKRSLSNISAGPSTSAQKGKRCPTTETDQPSAKRAKVSTLHPKKVRKSPKKIPGSRSVDRENSQDQAEEHEGTFNVFFQDEDQIVEVEVTGHDSFYQSDDG